MWVPEHFRELEPSWELELLDTSPFALLVNTIAGVPVATHLPVVIEPEDRERAANGLDGTRILGHLARENHQWQRADDADVLLVIGGPNAYVSPVVYSDLPAAPTWNYASVHVTGSLRWIHDTDEMMRIIDLTIDRTEVNEGTEWDREPSRPYFERIIRGIVGFEVEVSSSDATFKFSQDQPPHRRHEVVAPSDQSSCPHAPGGERLKQWTIRANPDVFEGPGNTTSM